MKKSVFIQKLSLLTCVNYICGERELVSGKGENFSVEVAEKVSGNIRYLAVTLENTSHEELIFSRAFVRIDLAPGPYEYFAQHSRWSAENQGSWAPLNENGLLLTHRDGRTTEGNTPYIAFRAPGEEAGTAFHVFPMGNWRIRVMPEYYSNTEPLIHVDLGIRDEELAYRLAPGEKWELPQILIQDFSSLDDSCPELHAFLRENFVSGLQKELPVIYNSWLDRFHVLDVPHLRAELAAAKEVGCEVFVIDAGWFGGGESWGGVGDWYEKTQSAFYGKMKEFADEVRAAGLGFGLWMEPERIAPMTRLAEEHPEYLLPTGSQFRFDFDNPQAYEHLKNDFRRLISTYGIRYLKTDMNATLGKDPSGRELYGYQKKFLQLIGEVKAEFPDLVIENCSSGAMRAELTTLQHFDLMFCSDNANAYTMLGPMHGAFLRTLPGRILRWVTVKEIKDDVAAYGDVKSTVISPGEATWEEYTRVDLESCLAANFTGVMGFSGSLSSLSPHNRAVVKKYIDLFKEKRSFMRDAASRYLVDQEKFQLYQQELNGEVFLTMVYIGRDCIPKRTIFPKGLKEDAIYLLNGEDTGRTGKEIMENGLEVECVAQQHYYWRASLLHLLPASACK